MKGRYGCACHWPTNSIAWGSQQLSGQISDGRNVGQVSGSLEVRFQGIFGRGSEK